MSYAANRDRLFVCLVWKTLRGLITYSSLATVLLTTAVSIGILLFAERIAERSNYSLSVQEQRIQNPGDSVVPTKFWGLSKAAWLGVSGSIFASAVFWLVQGTMYLFSEAKKDTYEETYTRVVQECGLTTIFGRKGGDQATKEYKRAIKEARERIWAIGMSNKHFTLQHMDTILDLIKRESSLEVVIAFWNPDAYLTVRKNGPDTRQSRTGQGRSGKLTPKRSSHNSTREGPTTADAILKRATDPLAEGLPAFVVQATLEGRAPGTAQEIRKRQSDIRERIEKEKSQIKGNIKIINLSMVTYISCMIMDRDVFFFPYLCGADSNDSPMFYCDATRGVGEQIYLHVKKLLTDKDYEMFCEEVYSAK
jgi:hypothetical protein